MQQPTAPPKPPPPPPPLQSSLPPSGSNGATTRTARKDFSVSRGVIVKPQKIVIYGAGGSGKTSLCANLEKVGVKTLLIDVEQGSHFLSVNRLESAATWDDLRDALHSPDLLRDYGAVVIDSATKAEEMAESWTVANVMNDSGKRVPNIEAYGWGKGLTHLYDTFLHLLGDLDTIAANGKHVVMVCHECTNKVPNPMGEDWIRFEPRLQSPASGKNSIRLRIKEWADHVLFIGFDVAATKDGKGQGSGTRTIYTQELPMFMAKSRSLDMPIPYEKDSAEIWKQLLK